MIRCQNFIINVNDRSVHTSSKLQHKPSVAYFDKSLTALLISSCGKLPQVTWSTSLTSAIVFGFVLSLE